MKHLLILILISAISRFSVAQNIAEPVILAPKFIPEFIDFSPDDMYMVLENENQYEVWNMESPTKVLDGKYAFKLGRYATGVSIPTGSGYFLFGEEGVFMTIDYQRNNTAIKAFSLIDGTKLWESDELDMGVTMAETILSTDPDVPFDAAREAKQTANNFFTKDRFLDRLINYVPEKHAISLNGKNGLQLVDIRNGKTLWVQKEFKGGIGELLYEPHENKLLAITVPATDSALDELITVPEVKALNAETGELLWSVAYTGEFVPGYASLIQNTLVLPYLELTLIDIETGEERDGDIKERLKGTRDASRAIGGIMALDKALNGSQSQAQDNAGKYNRLIPRQLYFDQNGRLCYFTTFNDKGKLGVGVKKGYLNIDVHEDKVEVEKYSVLDNQWTVMQDHLSNGVFYVKSSGNMNRTIITAIDPKNGEVIFETEKAKNSADLAKAFNPFLVNQDRIIDIVSKGIYIFDAKTGEKLAYSETKDLGVGTVMFSRFYDEGIILFGTKGVGVLDFDGQVVASIPSKNVKDCVVANGEIWLLENKKFTRLDSKQGKTLESIEFKQQESVSFSASGSSFVRVDPKRKELFVYR